MPSITAVARRNGSATARPAWLRLVGRAPAGAPDGPTAPPAPPASSGSGCRPVGQQRAVRRQRPDPQQRVRHRGDDLRGVEFHAVRLAGGDRHRRDRGEFGQVALGRRRPRRSRPDPSRPPRRAAHMATRTGWLSARPRTPASCTAAPGRGWPAGCGSASISPSQRRAGCPGSPGTGAASRTGCSRYARPRSSVTDSPDRTCGQPWPTRSWPEHHAVGRRSGLAGPSPGVAARKRSFTPPGVSVAQVSSQVRCRRTSDYGTEADGPRPADPGQLVPARRERVLGPVRTLKKNSKSRSTPPAGTP